MTKATRTPLPVTRTLRQIGDHIATWRKLRGLTQAQLAERAGIGRGTLVRIEHGDNTTSLEATLRVLRALGILDGVAPAIDPLQSDVGRMRSDERLPQRVRPRDLDGTDGG